MKTIRQVADKFDITIRTLRFWETKDLIAPKRSGSQRQYSENDEKIVSLILQGQEHGMSLEQIKYCFDYSGPRLVVPTGMAFDLQVSSMAEAEIAAIKSQKARGLRKRSVASGVGIIEASI